jgi:hypothetical protein
VEVVVTRTTNQKSDAEKKIERGGGCSRGGRGVKSLVKKGLLWWW